MADPVSGSKKPHKIVLRHNINLNVNLFVYNYQVESCICYAISIISVTELIQLIQYIIILLII